MSPASDSEARRAERDQAGGADPLVGADPAAATDLANAPKSTGARRPGRLRRAWQTAALPVLSIVLALLVGAVLMIISTPFTDKGFQPDIPIRAYGALLEGAFGSPALWAKGNFNGISNTLIQAAPLMFGGLAVGLAFKAGLFNIGVAGQFLVGAFAAAIVGARLADVPTNFAAPLSLLAGAIAGAGYGFIPGFLKARTGAHEVVVTIMLNSIAVLLLAWAVNDLVKAPGFSFPRTADIGNAKLPALPIGRNLHLGVVLAFFAVFVVKFILDRTTLGFEIRTVGANPNAARYAGIRPVFIITLTMALSGLLGGLAGAVQMLGVIGFYAPGITANVGFDSITVALLGRSSPIGIMLAALLFGVFRAGQGLMQINTSVPIEVIDVIQAVIILFLAADIIVRRVFRLRAVKGALEGEVRTVTQSWGEQVAR
jgi:general nucleoside transport system permease protein